jgi:subtilisin family serine protease
MSKISVPLLLLCLCAVSFAQQPINKISPALETKMSNVSANDEILVWIYFTDKGNNTDVYFRNPELVVSEKSLKRREKVLSESSLITMKDIPVNKTYISQVELNGLTLKHQSKWLNAVSGTINKSRINEIALLPFVSRVDVVYKLRKEVQPEFDNSKAVRNQGSLQQPAEIHSLDYGDSYSEMEQINVPAVHDLGITGQGVTICLMDAGFSRLSHTAFDSMNIIAAWDFVNNDPNVGNQSDSGDGSHGTMTLSTIGGYAPGHLIGPAFNATYILTKTENTDSETPIEEDNWIAAMEWADSIGVDVTSTSLGYLDFDPPWPSYTWMDMDGNTTIITNGADYATHLGIVVVNSAGNEGYNSSHNTLGAPADGDSVITAGAVDYSGSIAYFSSVGPTVDGRIKPDIMALGDGDIVASPYDDYSYEYASGTSFSCPLSAGVAALILSANPSLTPMQVRDAMRNTASQSNNPDNEYGWGILNALDAVDYFPTPVELESFTARIIGGKVNLEWSTATEKNNRGFEIQRKTGTSDFMSIGFAQGQGTKTDPTNYSYTDYNSHKGLVTYRLKQIDFDGKYTFSKEVTVDVPVATDFILEQNYPNPFNPTTRINYSVPYASQIRLALYDILGNQVKVLTDEEKAPGNYSYTLNAAGLSSGVYFVRLNAGSSNWIIKITLTK